VNHLPDRRPSTYARLVAVGRYALIMPAVVVGSGALLISEFKLPGILVLVVGVAAGVGAMRFATTPARIALIVAVLMVVLTGVAIGAFVYDCSRYCT
jgi:hypothetical protein